MPDELYDSGDLALRLGVTPWRVTKLLAANPDRYGAWKQRGKGWGSTPFHTRWRVPAASLELLREDMGRKG